MFTVAKRHLSRRQRVRLELGAGQRLHLLGEEKPWAALSLGRTRPPIGGRFSAWLSLYSVLVDTLTSIRVFRQVVESGSFVGASERLDISTAMVSKHVMHIEERLGMRLLNRNSRTLSLTEPGKIYFQRCKTILEDLEETELELGALGSAPRGTLRVSCPSWSPGQRLANYFAEYRRRCPDVILDVSFDDRMVDLVEEGYDVAIRVASSDSLSPSLIARPVRPVPFFLAASAEYIRLRGLPKSPAELSRHDFVAVGTSSSLQFIGPNGNLEVPVRTVLRYRSAFGIAHAVASGIGLAPLPAFLLEDPVFKGRLTPVLTDYPLSQSMVYLVYVSRKYLPLKIRTFLDFMVEAISQSAVTDPHPLAIAAGH